MSHRIQIICVPYAGGSSYMYNDLKANLHNYGIDVIPIDLPGKGTRILESPCADFTGAVESTVDEFLKIPQYRNAIVLGYSMGGLLAYEAVRTIHRRYGYLPLNTFICACNPPCASSLSDVPIANDDSFCQYLIDVGGISKELAVQQEFREFFLPIVKNDYIILQSYKYIEQKSPLPCRATIVYSEDECSISDWNKYFSRCDYRYIDGGHYFIHKNGHVLAQFIKEMCQGE